MALIAAQTDRGTVMAVSITSLFREPTTAAGHSPVYEAQRRDYNERYSIHEQNARRWRLGFLFSNVITFIAVIGLVYDDSLSKYVPYVVERDHLGDEVAIGPANLLSPCDARTIQAEINKWIFNVRVVSADGLLLRHIGWEAYNHTDKSGPAPGMLDEWFKENNPFKRAEDLLVTTTTISTLPSPPDQWKTWTAKWREDDWSRTGTLQKSQNKEMTVTVSCKHPHTETEFKKNASGVFVYSFDWNK